MSMNIEKWAPWNWFKNEDEQQEKRKPAVPSVYNQHPLMELHREMDRIFDRAFQGFNMPSLDTGGRISQSLLKPNVDIKEGKKNYTISVEVAGVDEGDVKLELADGTLTISGEKKHEKEDKDENYHCVERSYGTFRRVLSLPQDANEENIEAKFKNGILKIIVPRKQVSKPETETKVIDIKNAA